MWLAEEEVLDFEQRLCFMKREEKAQQHNIAPYLATMQRVSLPQGGYDPSQ